MKRKLGEVESGDDGKDSDEDIYEVSDDDSDDESAGSDYEESLFSTSGCDAAEVSWA